MNRARMTRAASAALATAGLCLIASPFAANATATNLLLNPGFEDPAQTQNGQMIADADVPGWETTDDQGEFEIWLHADGTDYTEGENQYIELNAWSAGAVYQDIATTPCDVLTWTVDHRARMVGTDVMHVLAGATGGTGAEGLTALEADTKNGTAIDPTTEISDDIDVSDNDATWDNAQYWNTWSGSYQVPAGQTSTRIAFAAVSSAAGDESIGNFLDNVVVTAESGTCPAAADAGLATTGADATAGLATGATAIAVGALGLIVSRRRATK